MAQPMTTSSLSGAKSTATVTPWPGRHAWPVTVAGGVAATGAGATGAVAAISDRVIRGFLGCVEVFDQVEQQDGVDGERSAVDAGLGEGPGGAERSCRLAVGGVDVDRTRTRHRDPGCDAVDGGQEPGGGGEGEAGGGSGGGHGGLGADGAADLDRVAARGEVHRHRDTGARRAGLPGDRGRRRRGRRCRSGQQRRRDEQQARGNRRERPAVVRNVAVLHRHLFRPGNERGAHRPSGQPHRPFTVGSGETARSPGAQGVSVPAPGDRHGAPCGTPGPTLHSSTEGATPCSASVRLASQSHGTVRRSRLRVSAGIAPASSW